MANRFLIFVKKYFDLTYNFYIIKFIILSKVLIPWIKLVVEKNFELAASCLLPYPPEFARVGGVWGTMSKRSTQIKEEFEKLSCLISYDIITYDVSLKLILLKDVLS